MHTEQQIFKWSLISQLWSFRVKNCPTNPATASTYITVLGDALVRCNLQSHVPVVLRQPFTPTLLVKWQYLYCRSATGPALVGLGENPMSKDNVKGQCQMLRVFGMRDWESKNCLVSSLTGKTGFTVQCSIVGQFNYNSIRHQTFKGTPYKVRYSLQKY